MYIPYVAVAVEDRMYISLFCFQFLHACTRINIISLLQVCVCLNAMHTQVATAAYILVVGASDVNFSSVQLVSRSGLFIACGMHARMH